MKLSKRFKEGIDAEVLPLDLKLLVPNDDSGEQLGHCLAHLHLLVRQSCLRSTSVRGLALFR